MNNPNPIPFSEP